MLSSQSFLRYTLVVVCCAVSVIQISAQTEDSDGDTVQNSLDNCLLVANVGQADSDGDGWGNACDADFNNDGVINFLDVSLFGDAFLSTDPVYDLNDDGAVNFVDYVRVTQAFNSAPGPAGYAIWQPGFSDFWDLSDNWYPSAVPTSLTHVVSTQDIVFVLVNPGTFEVGSMELNGARLRIEEFSGGSLVIEGSLITDDLVSVRQGSLQVNESIISDGEISIEFGVLNVGGNINTSGDIVLGSSATLEVRGSIEFTTSGTLFISGFGGSCLIKDARIAKPFGLVAIDFEFNSMSDCVFDNVTLAAKARIPEEKSIVIENDLFMENGDIEILGGFRGGKLVFPGMHTIFGNGEIPFVSNPFDDEQPAVVQSDVGTPVLTIGPDILIGIDSGGGTIGSPAGEVILQGTGIVQFSDVPLVFASGTTTLQGTIRTLGNQGGSVRFLGDLITEPGSILRIGSSGELLGDVFIHEGEMFLNNSELLLGPETGGNWSGAGLIISGFFDDSSVTLNYDVATDDINFLNGDISQFIISSTIDNTSSFLSSSVLGDDVILADGGRINGGSVFANSSNSQSWSVSADQQAFTFDDVALSGSLFIESGATLRIENGLQLSGEIEFADGVDPAVMELSGSQTIDVPGSSALLRFLNTSGDPARNWLKPTGEQTIITVSGEIILAESNTTGRIGDVGSSLIMNGELAQMGINSQVEILADTLTLNDELRIGSNSTFLIDVLDTQFGFNAVLGSAITNTGNSLFAFVNEPRIQGIADFDLSFNFVPTECAQYTFMTYPSIQFVGSFLATGDPLPNGLDYALIHSPTSSDVKLVGPSCPSVPVVTL